MVPNFIRIFNECKGQYIALLEGDDYWIDPLKLQKQVDSLEKPVNATICFHNAIVIWHNIEKQPNLFCASNQAINGAFPDVVKQWLMPTASIVFKRSSVNLPDWFPKIRNWDWAVQMLATSNGKFIYLNEPMSVYRKHLGGNSFNPDYTNLQTFDRQITLLNLINKQYNFTFNEIICEKICEIRRLMKIINRKNRFGLFYYLSRPAYSFKSIVKNVGRKI